MSVFCFHRRHERCSMQAFKLREAATRVQGGVGQADRQTVSADFSVRKEGGGMLILPAEPDGFISSRGISDSSDRIAAHNGRVRRGGKGGERGRGEVKGRY